MAGRCNNLAGATGDAHLPHSSTQPSRWQRWSSRLCWSGSRRAPAGSRLSRRASGSRPSSAAVPPSRRCLRVPGQHQPRALKMRIQMRSSRRRLQQHTSRQQQVRSGAGQCLSLASGALCRWPARRQRQGRRWSRMGKAGRSSRQWLLTLSSRVVGSRLQSQQRGPASRLCRWTSPPFMWSRCGRACCSGGAGLVCVVSVVGRQSQAVPPDCLLPLVRASCILRYALLLHTAGRRREGGQSGVLCSTPSSCCCSRCAQLCGRHRFPQRSTNQQAAAVGRQQERRLAQQPATQPLIF